MDSYIEYLLTIGETERLKFEEQLKTANTPDDLAMVYAHYSGVLESTCRALTKELLRAYRQEN